MALLSRLSRSRFNNGSKDGHCNTESNSCTFCSSDGSYKHGDTIDLSIDVRNIENLEYNSGGNVEFYYLTEETKLLSIHNLSQL